MEQKRRFAIATSTRADWGLLSPLAHELERAGCDVDILATNMHLLPECGMTVDEIIADGFTPKRVPVGGSVGEISSQVLAGFYDILSEEKYEAIVILGDRYEMLSVAQAAVLCGVPIIHIAGGTVSQGAFDEYFRHAITKMATLHLTETDLCSARVKQMGENPDMVHTVGALGVARFMNEPLMPIAEVEKFVGMTIDRRTLLITMHDASSAEITLEEQYKMLLESLDTLPEMSLLFTHPNNDVDVAPALRLLNAYAKAHPERVKVIPSLGHKRYLTAVRHVGAVVGNSSSGLVEVPSTGTPTLDIGSRQDGREHGPGVIRCGVTTPEIIDGLRRVLSPEHIAVARQCENPYARRDTIERMASIILNTPFNHSPQKIFHEI